MAHEIVQKWKVAYRKYIGDKMYTPTIGVGLEYENHIEIKLDAMPMKEFWRDGSLLLFPIPNRED